MADERKLKHLEMIQGVINRLAANSFMLKGWSVFLISALFVLAARDAHPAFALFIYIPVLIFWLLDGFFLWQERLYRKLYDHVRSLKDSDVDFSMNTTPFKTTEGPMWVGATLSKTLIPFYGALILTVTAAAVLTVATGEEGDSSSSVRCPHVTEKRC